MLNHKNIIPILFSLLIFDANAGFWDNLTDNLKSGDLDSLITDVVKDVAKEIDKGSESSDMDLDAFTDVVDNDTVKQKTVINSDTEKKELTSSKAWDEDIDYITKDNPLGIVMVYQKDATKIRIGDVSKLNFPVVNSQDKYTPSIFSVSYESMLNKLYTIRENRKNALREKILTTALQQRPVATLIYHLENYLGRRISKDQIQDEKIRQALLNPGKHNISTRTRNKIAKAYAGTKILDILLDTNLMENLTKKVKLPTDKEGKLEALQEALSQEEILIRYDGHGISPFQITRQIVESIKEEVKRVKVPRYKPYQKEIALSDVEVTLTPGYISHNNNLFYNKDDNTLYTGDWTVTPSKKLSIYAHDYSGKTLDDIDRSISVGVTAKDYKIDNYIMKVKKVKYIAEKGKLVKIIGLYLANNNKYPAFEVSMKDGKYHGEYREYYKSGRLAKSVFYKNGLKDGQYKQYSKFKDTVLKDRFGNSHTFSQQTLVAEGNYSKGRRNGNLLYIYPNSMRPSVSGQYENGKRSGKWTTYSYGNLVPGYSTSEGYVKKGRADRFRVLNFKDLELDKKTGAAKIKGNGKRLTGRAITYYKDGGMAKSGLYANGIKDGKEFDFYENGYPKSMSTYSKGRLHGLQRKWDVDGYIIYESSYKNGNKDGSEKTYHSLKDMREAGHVFSDVAWTTKDLNIKENQHKMKGYLQRGAKNLDNKHADYVVAIYNKDGMLVTDSIYSKNIMSHPSIGFSVYLPLKSTTRYTSGSANGKHVSYYPNGHKLKDGNFNKGKKDGKWMEYHAWRPNAEKTGNILLKTKEYKNGDLIAEKEITNDANLNTYSGKTYDTSYKQDMKYVTGLRQTGVCFNCSKVKEKPQFKRGFEFRRNVMTGTLPMAIAKVAQQQTDIVLATKDVKNAYDGGIIGLNFTRTTSGEKVAFNWKDDVHPAYDEDKITGGYYSDISGVKFSKFDSTTDGGQKIKSATTLDDRNLNHNGYNIEKYIAKLNKEIPVFDTSTNLKKSLVKKQEKLVNDKLCVYKDFEETREFNRRLVDLTLVPIPMNASILGQSMSKANEQSFDMYSGEYIDFLKSLRIRKSEKWNTKIRKPRNELKFDKGFFSSSWLDKETGEPFSGWGEQNHENGNIKKEWFFDEGVMLYQAFYFPNGQLKDEQYLSGTKRHGPALGYYKNGTQRFVAYFVNGEKWLPTINYYENGNIKGNFLYWNGKEAGYANSFHENGELHDQTLFGKSPDPEYISLISDGSSNKPKRRVRDDGGEVISRVFCKDNGLKHVEEEWSRMDDHRGFTGKLMVRTALRMYDKNGALEYDTAGLEMKTRKRKSSFKKGYIWVKVPKDDKVGYENVKKRTSVKKEALKDKSAINLEDFMQENHDPLNLRINISNLQKGPDGSCIICNAEDRKSYYKGKRFTGTWFHVKNGMFFERGVIEGITDGRDEAWNSKGVKRKTQFYKAGRAHGLARTWDDSGKIIESKYFIKGKEVNEKDWNRHQKNQ